MVLKLVYNASVTFILLLVFNLFFSIHNGIKAKCLNVIQYANFLLESNYMQFVYLCFIIVL